MSTAAETNLRMRAAMDAVNTLLRPEFTMFVHPSQLIDLLGLPPPELQVGDRVWLYPGKSYGIEATVTGAPFDCALGDGTRVVPVVDIEGDVRAVGAEFVVLFDENHNQKRAFSRGKRIEARIRPTTYNRNYTGRWHYVPYPNWDGAYEYRVQPPKAERDYTVQAYVDPAPIKRVVEFAAEKAAYAEGKAIEYRSTYPLNQPWSPCTVNGVGRPLWLRALEYRVKPEPVVTHKTYGRSLDHEGVYVTLDVERTDGKVTNVTVKDFS